MSADLARPRVKQRQHLPAFGPLGVQCQAGGMTAMAIDNFVDSALRRRAYANGLELALARDVRFQAVQILVLAFQAQGVSVRELARADLFGIELEHDLAALALGFEPRDRLD